MVRKVFFAEGGAFNDFPLPHESCYVDFCGPGSEPRLRLKWATRDGEMFYVAVGKSFVDTPEDAWGNSDSEIAYFRKFLLEFRENL